MISLCETQVQKVGDVGQPQYRPDENRHDQSSLVMLDIRNGQAQSATLGNQLAGTGGKHVSHPISTGAVGQRDNILVSVVEHIDRCFVDAASPSTAMDDDSKSRKVTGKRSRQMI